MKVSAFARNMLNRAILHSMDNPSSIGLLNGQMGLLIVIAQCSRQWNMPSLDRAADFIFEYVSENTGRINDCGFANGLCGMCWGVEYLVQKGLMPPPANNICEDIDRRIVMSDIRNISDFSFDTGLLGRWFYVSARIAGNIKANIPIPFPDIYISDWQQVLRLHPEAFPSDSIEWLNSAISGEQMSVNLSIKPFIKPMKRCPRNNLSLHDGIAGYIATHYLTDI